MNSKTRPVFRGEPALLESRPRGKEKPIMELSTILTIMGTALAVATFFIGRMTSSQLAGKEKGSLVTDIKYIKASIDRIEKRFGDDISRLEIRAGEVSVRLTDIGQEAAQAAKAAKSAHRRLDEHLGERIRHKK